MSDRTDMEIVAASRSAAGLPLSMGKCTERVSADLPDELFADMTRRRLSLGMGEAEYLRFAVMRDTWGDDKVRRLHQERMAVLFGSGPESVG